MVQLVAFRRSLVLLALAAVSLVFVASATPASASSHHRAAGRQVRVHHVHHHARYLHRHARHYGRHYRIGRHGRRVTPVGDATQAQGFHGNASFAPQANFGSSNVVAEARRYIGGNPTGRSSLWCARFMNMVLQRSGHHGTGSDMARSFASYGQRVSGPQIGAIAVMGRRGGGHVGVVSGIDASGNPILVSGNNRNRVVEAPISRGRVYAYVLPTG